MIDERAEVLGNQPIAPAIWQIDFRAPSIAATVQPGQFVHVKVPCFDGHVLRRPFSVCCWEDDIMTILYQVVGGGTDALTHSQPGTPVMAMGPVGHGWNPPAGVGKALLVAGGMGVAPLTMLAKGLVQAGCETICAVGATTAKRLVGVDRLESFGARVEVATDDGTFGYHGFCTDFIGKYAQDCDYVAVCGPEPMERVAMSEIAKAGKSDVCEVSLERRMACGIGACLSCVVDTVDGHKRACVDGPVFEAQKVVWR